MLIYLKTILMIMINKRQLKTKQEWSSVTLFFRKIKEQIRAKIREILRKPILNPKLTGLYEKKYVNRYQELVSGIVCMKMKKRKKSA